MSDVAAPWCIEPRHELPLRILLAPDSESLDAARGWLGGVDLDRLEPDTGLLLPQIYLRLRDLGVEHEEMARLRGVHRHHWYRNHLRLEALRPALEALADRGVPAAPLGGLMLVPRCYGDWGARPVSRAEILVPERALRSAIAVLDGQGWQHRDRGGAMTPAHVAARSSILFHARDGFDLAVSWRSYDWGPRPRAGVDLSTHSQPSGLDGIPLRGLEPAEMLLLACVLDPTRQPAPPIWVADAAAVLRCGVVDWRRLVQRAREANVGGNAARALEVLMRTFGQPVPPDVTASLRAGGADQDRAIARLHRRGAEVGPALYRFARLLARSRDAYAPDDFLGYFRDLWGLGRRRDVPGEVLRRGWRRSAAALS